MVNKLIAMYIMIVIAVWAYDEFVTILKYHRTKVGDGFHIKMRMMNPCYW